MIFPSWRQTTFWVVACRTWPCPPRERPGTEPAARSLAELAAIALGLTRTHIDNLDNLRRWLAVLEAPGASQGGARPKASFCDRRGHHTFCVQRFDRDGTTADMPGKRRFYASAMTLLGKDASEGASYLELAEFLARRGDPAYIQEDLEQLFCRVAFNVAGGNRDDHLRNHGFILGRHGWRLSPAFDLNPSIDKASHVLNIDDADNRPSLHTVLATAAFYRLAAKRAREIVDHVVTVVSHWKDVARRAGISSAEIDLSASAFEARL